jgi:predicted transcriptional regulator of viral defense system
MGHVRHMRHNRPLRTVGPQTAHLIATLYDRAQTTFSNTDVASITGLGASSARSLIRKAEARGLVTRLKPGLFVLVPPELGSEKEYSGNPYLTARAMAGGAQYYISHASAMELHRMVTQPQFTVFTSTTKRLRNRTIHGTEFRFVFVPPEHIFGVGTQWITKQDAVRVSNLERTLIDGLRQPEYCGGIVEVAKGLWMRHTDLKTSRIIEYALRLGVGSVMRRLGYLLEFYCLAPELELQRLRSVLTVTYSLLDPVMPNEGPYMSRWRLRLNVPPEELDAIRST